MAKPREAREPARNHASSTRWRGPFPWPSLLAAAAAIAVYQGALHYFFAQDDFSGLARARGLAPPLTGIWRWLSGQGYFDLMRPFGLASAAPYHAVSLAVHAATSGLLASLLCRRFAWPAALAGALFYAAHPAHYTALYSVSGIGELLSALFTLLAIRLATRRGGARWLAPLAFALALISKESVLLLPLALWPRSGWLAPADAQGGALDERDRARHVTEGPAPPSERRLIGALAGVALVVAAMIFASDVFGLRTHLATSAPYAVSPGPHVAANLATYAGWAVNVLILTVRGFSDAIDPSVYPWAAAAAAAWLLGFSSRKLRARGWAAGGLTFLALLAPVLGLRNHTYHYYLVAPLLGVAWCVSAALDLAIGRSVAGEAKREPRHSPRTAKAPAARTSATSPRGLLPILILILGAIMVLNGVLLVHKIETYPFTDPRLRSDATVDRARIARNVYDGLRAAELSPGAPLILWSPASLREEQAANPAADVRHETYWERNVRSALMDGLAIRVLFPTSGDVTFVHQYAPPARDARVALYDVDGSLRVMTSAALDSAIARERVGASH